MSIATLTNFAGSIGGVASAASSLASFLGGPLADSWWGSLRQASFGGVPFAVLATNTRFGSRNVVHEYPFNDDVWIEGLSKLPRRFEITGFLIENSLVYGGGPVIEQRDQLVNACEGGASSLVHPTFGRIDNVACLESEASESVDHGRVIMIRMVFMKTGLRLYPSGTTDSHSLLDSLASSLGVSSALDFARHAAQEVQLGAAVVQTAVSTAVGWYQMALTGVHDVTRLFNSVSTLSGNFGRLFGAGNSGYAGSSPALQAAVSTGPLTTQAAVSSAADQLLAADTANVTAVQQTGAALQDAAANVSDTATFTSAVQAFVAAFSASASGPSDGIRLLTTLAGYAPAADFTGSTIGSVMQAMQDCTAALFRRAAIAAIAQTVANWQPASADDAAAMTSTVTDLLDAEIETAANADDDASFGALRELRNGVVTDLRSRGGGLAALATMTFSDTMPALTIAHRVYGDATRADQLVQQVQPVHPLFMPTSFRALAT
ncbi:DNA circularization protein [Paraburkholderia caballeronis]|uniref:Mu-like prophage DNA circulation protein n=1 Tax=Paraburkholderia caballeronis TaxID=416943 RepID=A0A1H7U159_9BURK|nr:DNA circularization N-terminal domain-containing protein [Paraburkholderia caballeronis]PXW23412.1 prophage DNA circulation protein [Paraburkholderia caballeronis]PXW98405.1 prophage DNA circulation protein [Paraburkholderia caballeronis]RAJ95136.1 prophage DNA circulation protein [Paraburkholderia caballeronis]SEC55003.1 Mu-like prophage DNA circulation protein [Paraburkholderia caballeronis]SEL89977.1 Mu-like prophage DNA circulation protein [Paraburkholderia caballeronis]